MRFLNEKISKIMRFLNKKQHFLYKKWKFIMHFCDLCWMKNTFFIKKKMRKNRTFSLRFVRFFRIFGKSKKFYKYKMFFAFSPWPPVNIRATTGRSWADHGRQADRTEIKFRKKIREKFFTKKSFACKFRYYTHIACKII